jgi:hypothetical protein
VTVRRGELLEIEELRNREGLLVTGRVPVLLIARRLGADAEIVAGDFAVGMSGLITAESGLPLIKPLF